MAGSRGSGLGAAGSIPDRRNHHRGSGSPRRGRGGDARLLECPRGRGPPIRRSSSDRASRRSPGMGGSGRPAPGGPTGRGPGESAVPLRRCPLSLGRPDSLGFDCSGFVQQCFARGMSRFPRCWTSSSVSASPSLSGEPAGDLVFFGRPGMRVGHVGILRGGGLFVHARGTVHLGSLDPHNPLYDQALAATVRGFRSTPSRGEGRGTFLLTDFRA